MEIIGYLAGIFTAGTMAPQIIKTIRTKNVRDLSVYMIMMYIFNAVLWVIYGISIRATPLIMADGFALAAGCIQMVLKLKYHKNGKEEFFRDL